MKKIVVLISASAALIVAGCGESLPQEMITYNTTSYAQSAELFITGQIDQQFPIYPSISKKSVGGLFIAPGGEELCYLAAGKVLCVDKGEKNNVLHTYDSTDHIQAYQQILHKKNTYFTGVSFTNDPATNKVFLYYEEYVTGNKLPWTMNRFTVDLTKKEIYKIDGGQAAMPGQNKLTAIQGDYLLDQTWDYTGASIPTVGITNYVQAEGIISIAGTGIVIDPLHKIIIYKLLLPKCAFVDLPLARQMHPDFVCDENDGLSRKRENKQRCSTFTGVQIDPCN